MESIMNKETAVKTILESNGKIFTVTFNKRSNSEERVMNCRLNVTKHLRGGTLGYDPKVKQLIIVWDLKNEGYRSIPMEGITNLKINNNEYQVA